MRLIIAFAMTVVASMSLCVAAPLRLSRGVGVHGWLNWSPLEADGSYRRPPYRTVGEWLSFGRPLSDWPSGNEFERIRAMGFDFIRLTVDPGPLLDGDSVARREALDVLSDAVRRVTRSGLRVVFNLHAVSQVPAYSSDIFNGPRNSDYVVRYRSMVKDVAAMLARIGAEKVAFEPYNEPGKDPCEASDAAGWQNIMSDTVSDIRAVSSDLTIVATGACYGGVAGLLKTVPSFDDGNILYSFHMYEPFVFTHQRGGASHDFVSGLPWPSSAASPETVHKLLEDRMKKAGVSPLRRAAELEKADNRIAGYFKVGWDEHSLETRIREAVEWAKLHGVPSKRLFMGEFGVIRMSDDGLSGAFDQDRLRYLKVLRRIAEKNYIPWSIWEYSNPHGMSVIAPIGPAVPDTDLLDALGLTSQ